MVEKLTIKNFQSHERSVLNFHPGVNVIVGPSDSGKSAILRALHWLIYNRPSGEAFRRIDSGITKVIGKFDDFILSRIRSDSSNDYLLKVGKSRERFSSFGVAVPEMIREILRMDDVNFQGQFHPPFMLSSSAGEVARELNRIANIDVIDTGFKNIISMVRRTESTITSLNDQKKEQEEELIKYKGIQKLSKRIARLIKLNRSMIKKEEEIEEIKRKALRLVTIKKKLKKHKKLVTLESQIISLSEDHDNLISISIEISKIFMLIKRLKSSKRQLDKNKKITELHKKVETLSKLSDDKESIESKIDSLRSIVKKLVSIDQEISEQEYIIEDLHSQLDEAYPDICPLCNQPMKGK